ncbi:MAG: FadR family transcriptional regulator [Desulfomonile tiedjei]|uniref:FadR family transcriptional regulator n=1 Tax=Desulfomonile tiedjei TaxID=2358 RepID=A0A9D6Z2Z6_9BACT|nr:FadR family transcriptional regulator [Desulfomonile tiedjei]
MNNQNNDLPEPLFTPIRLERISQKVANQLKKAISNGVLRVGERLPSERELAEQMGVSRPSIREAIQQLELQGIVEIVHGGGTIVKNITEQEILKPIEMFLGADRLRVLELTEIRALLETWAARQAALHRTEEELARMRGYLDEMEDDFEKGRIRYEIDFKFHTEIVAAAHNTIFLHLMSSIYQWVNYSIRIHREQVFVTKDHQQRIFDHHLKVFQAIHDQDPDAAEACMREHLVYVVEEFKQWSSSH